MRGLPAIWMAASLTVVTACAAESLYPPDRPARVLPAWFPRALAVGDYVGAAACAPCHQHAYDAWKRSPHGRGAALPSKASVLGQFDGRTIPLEGGSTSPRRIGDQYFFEVSSPSGVSRHRVELVVASGRQHQAYFTRIDGVVTMLPGIWSTRTRQWLPSSLYQHGSVDRTSRRFWQHTNWDVLTCFECHTSQGHRKVVAGGVDTSWIDLPINCESCHGPGRAHVEARRSGRPGGRYADLRNLDKRAEAALCGQCHGLSESFYGHQSAGAPPRRFPMTLGSGVFRPDGTQRSTTYQLAGHLLSGCFTAGSVTCSACHDPHRQTPRNLAGESAAGEHSNRQCTACHRDKLGAAAATKHSRHPASTRCIDCHMAMSWIGDSEAKQQRTADHSISIPHPQETIDVGVPNACTTCHRERSPQWALAALRRWGYTRATHSRAWVLAIDRALRRQPGAVTGLIEILKDPKAGDFLRASALDALVRLPATPQVVPMLEPLSKHRDPYLRSRAIDALIAHDADNASRWRKLGSRDPEPYVRLRAFAMGQRHPRGYSDGMIERFIADNLDLSPDPAWRIKLAAELRAQRGEFASALRTVDLALRIASKTEKQKLLRLRKALKQARARPRRE